MYYICESNSEELLINLFYSYSYSYSIADIFNRAITDQEVLSQIGHGIKIILPKPGKPVGAMTSIRPIVLLNTLRKTLSLIVLSRIADKVDEFLYPGQSGFRRGRSTTDVLFGYRWLAAKTQRFQKYVRVLGIDMSRAFDTIRRDKLLTVLETFVNDSELRLIRMLLAETTLQPRPKRGKGSTFATTIGTPQGDSLSPVLFVIYLEAALRDLRNNLPQRPREDINMPQYIAYADDVDFISNSNVFLNEVQRLAPSCLLQWHLAINESKTEHTNIHRKNTRDVEQWRKTRTLGSLLGDAEDVTRRKQLAAVAFQRMWSLWVRKRHISEELRLRLYNAFIVPVLTYTMGTWGLTPTEWARFDGFHRRQLRQVIGVRYPEKISSNALYEICECGPMSLSAVKARWGLFGHVMRMTRDTPAHIMAIDEYIAPTYTAGWQGRPRTTLPTTLDKDLHGVGKRLLNMQDLQHLRTIASDRNQWRSLSQEIMKAAQAKLTHS